MTIYTTRGGGEPGARSRSVREFRRSVTVWLGLMAYVVAVKLVITSAMPALFRDPSQAAVFSWPVLGGLTLAGLIGVWFAEQTGFPGALAGWVTPQQRFLLPALVGLALGLLYVVFDLVTGYSRSVIAMHGQTSYNIAFPANVLIYPAGAIIVEVIYRLLPIPLLLWLFSKVFLRGRGEAPIFWTLAVLTSAIEPLTQDLSDAALGPAILAGAMALDFTLNLSQAAVFRKYGFLASIVVRVAFYLVWHVAYVH